MIEILAGMTDIEKALDLLKQNFTFTHLEIAKNFQDSYGYALAAISSGLAAPENQRGFWQSLFQANVDSEFSQRLESDYVLPFAQQQGLTEENLSEFRQTAVIQCQQIATLTLFQADNVPFSETELASFVTASGASSMTNLVLELVQTQQTLDEQVKAFLQGKELLGNALLFFLHEQLRKEPRFQTTLAALQREGLIIDVREIKQIVQSTENKLNQALAEKNFGEVAQLGQQLEQLQQLESVTQTFYAQFLDFSQRFADWAQLVNVQLTQVLAALPKLQEKLGEIKNDLGHIKSDTEEILARFKQSQSPKPFELSIQPKLRIVQMDNKKWWNQLDDNWKQVFKENINVSLLKEIVGLNKNDLENIFNLKKLDCREKQLSDLEPLRVLTKLRYLDCSNGFFSFISDTKNQLRDLEPLCTLMNLRRLSFSRNKISDLEPLRALTNLQELDCSNNKISSLEPLQTLKNLKELDCRSNRITKLEPLYTLTNLQELYCWGNNISWRNIREFKKAVPNCKVYS